MFEGIAHEALSECVNSLLSASTAIKDKKVTMNNKVFCVRCVKSCLILCVVES